MAELPITFTEAAKILGCMNKDLVDAITEGKLITIKGDWNKIDPRSFRFYCEHEHGIQIDRLPERRMRFRQAAPQHAFTKNAAKKMKRKARKARFAG